MRDKGGGEHHTQNNYLWTQANVNFQARLGVIPVYIAWSGNC